MAISNVLSCGRVIWITGLSGAGKTTLARALVNHLPGAVLLDGDDLREALGVADSSFDAASRKRLAFIYARIAGLLARQGLAVVVATISLFHDVHAWNREHLPGYFEIFLDVPETVRCQRDAKGLYTAESLREKQQMAGREIPVEFPAQPDLKFDEKTSTAVAMESILKKLSKKECPNVDNKKNYPC